MRIFNRQAQPYVKIRIYREGEKDKYISVVDADRAQVVEVIESRLFEASVYTNPPQPRLKIVVRDTQGNKNLGSNTLTYFGITTEQAFEIITKTINNENQEN